MSLSEKIDHALYQRSKLNLNRQVQVANPTLKDFASNDYLGLASQNQAKRSSGGSGASVMVTGYSKSQQQLEECIADYIGMPSVMIFASGYQANIGILQALLDKQDHVLIDKLCHASIIDGLRLSGANWRRYRHQQHDHLAQLVQPNTQLVVSEGLFSMDGDWLDRETFTDASTASWRMVDDAHGFGLRAFNTEGINLYMGTFSKALGSLGGFVGASHECIQYLRQFSHSHVYSTALPPVVINQIQHNLAIAKSNAKQEQLWRNIALWQRLTGSACASPIQIINCATNEQTLARQQQLLQQGFMVGAIRRPTVASPRLRITLSAKQSSADIQQLAEQVMLW